MQRVALIGGLVVLAAASALAGHIAFQGTSHPAAVVTVAPTSTPTPLPGVAILPDAHYPGRFQPANVFVRIGTPVAFTNNTGLSHDVTSLDRTSFSSGDLPPRASWTFVPQRTGIFRYICLYHPHMHGAIVVQS